MKSFRILRHSIRQVFGNLIPATAAMMPVIVLEALVLLCMGAGLGTASAPMLHMAQILSYLIVPAWVVSAVRWHRFVLLEEPPLGWNRGRLLPYVGRALQAGLIGIAVMLPVILLMPLSADYPVIVFLPLLSGLVLSVLLMRLSVMFPAAAVGRGFGPLEALRRTRGTTLTLILVTLMLGMIVLVPGLLAALLMPPLTESAAMLIMLQVLQFLVSLAYTAISLSIATTLYGHHVEGRELI